MQPLIAVLEPAPSVCRASRFIVATRGTQVWVRAQLTFENCYLRAVLRVTDPDGHTRDVVVEAGGLTIGRAIDNDLVAVDGRVSRHHGRIVGRRGTLVYADLGSTNGSRVNGVPVTEVVLGVGDRLEVGDTALVVEVAGAPD